MESAPFTEDQRKHVQSFSDIKKPTKCIRRLLQKMKLWCQIEELKNWKIYEAAANIGIKQFEQTERGGITQWWSMSLSGTIEGRCQT